MTNQRAEVSTLSPDFSSIRITARVTRIYDRLDAQMYLVEGEQRALLVDTGFGVGDLASFIEGLTVKPITVVITHGHLDHAFGAGWFDDVHMAYADFPVHAIHKEWVAEVHDEARREGRIVAPAASPERFHDLGGGKVFDLGGITVRTIRMPGHTPGSHGVLLCEERTLITGDAANQRTFLFADDSSTVTAYSGMLQRVLDETSGLYDRVFISHATGDAPVTVLQDLIELSGRVVAGTDDKIPFSFREFSALLARQVLEGIEDPRANLVYRPDRV
jgi:hydroxyacylglutathione hydrolase